MKKLLRVLGLGLLCFSFNSFSKSLEIKTFTNEIYDADLNKVRQVKGMITLNSGKSYESKLFLSATCLGNSKNQYKCNTRYFRLWNDGMITMDSSHGLKASQNIFTGRFNIPLKHLMGCKLIYLSVDFDDLRAYHITRYNPKNYSPKACKKRITKVYSYELTGLLKGKNYDFMKYKRKNKNNK